MSNETLAEEQADLQPQEQGHDHAVERPAEVARKPTAVPVDAVEAPEDLTESPPTGPRGGTTTVTESGMVKKNLWVPGEMAERLRRAAYEQRVSEAHIMRRGLALVLEELE